ncbi:hypothetical protein POG22_02495 [Geitlerinema sp. CS-897]|nr:hypothetical protein [Geitlerinema sp. CS-897]
MRCKRGDRAIGTTPEFPRPKYETLKLQSFKMSVNPEGTWTIEDATTLRGQSYTGTVKIYPLDRLYQVIWLTDRYHFAGLGFVEDNFLFTGWGVDSSYCVVLYRINADGTLEGRWTTPQSLGQVGWERATGGTPGELEGLYQVAGAYSDNRMPYTNTLAIGKAGDVYQLSSSRSQQSRGIGLRLNDWLLVNWGYGRNYGVIAYEIDRDAATGHWTAPGADKVATERLAKIC